MAAVDGLDVQFSPDTLAGGLVERPMADAHRGGAGRITGAAVSDQQGVPIKDWLQNRLQMSGRHRRQYGADGHPERSAATRTGTCSCDNPRLDALPPRLRALRSRFRSPLRVLKTNVSSASTIPRSLIAPVVIASRHSPPSQPPGTGDASEKPCCRPPRSAPPRSSLCRHRLMTRQIPSSNPCVAAERTASQSGR